MSELKSICELVGRKVYISGRITGDPNYRAKFQIVEDKLKKMGCPVMNPALLGEGFPYAAYMPISYAMLSVVDCVYFMKGYTNSKGAMAEHAYALSIGKKVFYEE